jgi:putative AlgH/UPF0301 family transcriptional regulator
MNKYLHAIGWCQVYSHYGEIFITSESKLKADQQINKQIRIRSTCISKSEYKSCFVSCLIYVIKHRETGNIGYTRRKQTKQKHNTICVGHNYAQTNTKNVNKTPVLQQRYAVFTNVRNSAVIVPGWNVSDVELRTRVKYI